MNNDLISRSALLEQMHNHYEVRNPKQNATMDECCMMVIRAPAVDAGPKWISVEERLPEREGRYLCVKRIGKSGMVYVQIMNGDCYGFSMDHFYTDDVTHWMPLPEPPKEG